MSFSSVKRLPSVWTEQELERTSPPIPVSVVADASSSSRAAMSPEIVLHPRGTPVADHRRDLDLVHGVDHRGRRAVPTECLHRERDVGERGARATEIGRDQHREHALGAQRGDRLVREPRVAVDLVGGRRDDFGADARRDARELRRARRQHVVAARGGGRPVGPFARSSRFRHSTRQSAVRWPRASR